MAKVAHLLAVLCKQKAGDGFAAHDGFFKILEPGLIERSMSVSVITEIKAGVEPHIEGLDALIDLAPLLKQLSFINETDDGDFLLLKRGEKLGGHRSDFGRSHITGSGSGQIVDGDGDLSVGRSIRRTC